MSMKLALDDLNRNIIYCWSAISTVLKNKTEFQKSINGCLFLSPKNSISSEMSLCYCFSPTHFTSVIVIKEFVMVILKTRNRRVNSRSHEKRSDTRDTGQLHSEILGPFLCLRRNTHISHMKQLVFLTANQMFLAANPKPQTTDNR